MRAEVISIGDELTSGQRLDTNSQWLSQQLSNLGIEVLFHSTVGDRLDANVDVFRTAARRADIVVSSGGLGPTADDLTRQAMADAFELPLVYCEESAKRIAAMFAARGREMPERNRVQAYFPEGAKPIENRHGTAPGIDLVDPGSSCRFFALPGVPAEMTRMWDEVVRPRILTSYPIGEKQWFYRSLKIFGIGESDCEARLPGMIERDRVPRVGITVSKATITLRIACLAKDETEAMQQAASTEAEIIQSLGDLVFGRDKDELWHVVERMLVQRGESLAVIELGDDMPICDWMAQLPRDRDQRGKGFQTGLWYPNPTMLLKNWLSGWETIDGKSATDDWWYSPDGAELVQAVVAKAKSKLGCDWVLLVGAYPHRDFWEGKAGTPQVEFRMVLGEPNGSIRAEMREMTGHPDIMGDRIGKTSLDFLRKRLMQTPK